MSLNHKKYDPFDMFRGLHTFATVVLATFLNIGSGGCGTWAGNPKDPPVTPTTTSENSTVTLDVQGYDAAAQLLASTVDVTGRGGNKIGSILLSEARVVLKEIKIKSNSNDSKSRQKFNGPFVVDLLNNSSVPAIESISLEPGIYRSIELVMAKLEKGKSGKDLQQNDPMFDKSLLLQGTYTPLKGNAKPFTLSLDFDEKVEMGLAGTRSGVDISAGEESKLIIGFHLATWFNFSGQELDFSDLTDSTITLEHEAKSEGSQKMREYIKDNIKDSAKFARDKDHDGKITDIDDDEKKITEDEK